MKKTLVLTAALALSFGAVANAQISNNGSLALTGQVDGSIALQVLQLESGGITLTGGATTPAATTTTGAVSFYGTADNASTANNFTKTSDSTHIILTGGFGVQVEKANLTSNNYTLTASVTSADGNAWKLDTVALSSSPSTALLGGTSSYATPVTQTLVVTVPTSINQSTTAISGTINLTATAN